MGISGLQFFMEKKGLTEIVDITVLAKEFREEYDLSPILIADTSCFRQIYEKVEDDGLCGGQIKQYIFLLEKLVKNLQHCGVTLLFIIDGCPPINRLELWKQRRIADLKRANALMADLEANKRPDWFYQPQSGQMRTPTSYFTALNFLRAMKVKVIQTSSREADNEIIDYVNSNKCLGVLTQDSDFIIAEGVLNYLSIGHLDIKNMTTIKFRRDLLLQRLSLPQSELLPLFATLCGSDIVRTSQLRDFHLSLLRREWNYSRISMNDSLPKALLFPYIAIWLRKQCNKGITEPGRIAELAGLPELADKFIASVQSFRTAYNVTGDVVPSSGNGIWDRIVETVEAEFRHNYMCSKIYCVVVAQRSMHPVHLQYYLNDNLPSDGIVSRNLRLRFYGILLKEHPKRPTLKIIEYLTLVEDSELPETVSPIYPENHPGLLLLWSAKANLDDKWRLLCWSISDLMPIPEVRALPEQLQIPTMALFYICQEFPNMLKSWEVSALAMQAVRLITMSPRALYELKCQAEDPVAVHLATIYQAICMWIFAAAEACGQPIPFKLENCVIFDGKLFHTIYVSFKQRGTFGIELDKRETELHEKMLTIVNLGFKWIM